MHHEINNSLNEEDEKKIPRVGEQTVANTCPSTEKLHMYKETTGSRERERNKFRGFAEARRILSVGTSQFQVCRARSQDKSRLISPLIYHARNNTLPCTCMFSVEALISGKVFAGEKISSYRQTGAHGLASESLGPAVGRRNVKYDRVERICLLCPRVFERAR